MIMRPRAGIRPVRAVASSASAASGGERLGSRISMIMWPRAGVWPVRAVASSASAASAGERLVSRMSMIMRLRAGIWPVRAVASSASPASAGEHLGSRGHRAHCCIWSGAIIGVSRRDDRVRRVCQVPATTDELELPLCDCRRSGRSTNRLLADCNSGFEVRYRSVPTVRSGYTITH